MAQPIAKPATAPAVTSKPMCLDCLARRAYLLNEAQFHKRACTLKPDGTASEEDAHGESFALNSYITNLRQERHCWQLRSKKHEEYISRLARALSEVKAENIKLREVNAGAIASGKDTWSRFKALTLQHEKVVEQFDHAKRTLEKLRKSERKMTGFQQQHLSLKATLRRALSRGAPAARQADADVEAGLREALALATERIEDLESKGEALLHALEMLDESDGEVDGEGDCEMGAKPSLVEAEVAFRGVLDDDSFAEQRDNWEELLDK